MATSSMEEAFTSALSSFPDVDVLKPEQKECIAELLSKKDVLGLLPTGFGKSLIYQLFPRVHAFVNGGDKKCHVLVVSALKAITEEQVLELNEFGISAASIGDNRKTDNEILQGKFEVVFGSAEMWLRKEWTTKLKSSALQENVELLVVDEAHVSQSWGKASHKKKAFRAAYGDTGSLRSFLKPGTPLLALTATVEKKSREGLIRLLSLRSPKIVDVSINNKNIRFSTQKVEKGLACLNWLVNDIAQQQEKLPKTIVFCRSINDLSTVLSYLLMKLEDMAYVEKERSPTKCFIGVYHSNSPEELKDRVKKSLKNDDGPVRVVLATSALSLGVNFKDIRYVIHYGPAPDLRSQLQEAGRAGRDGKQAFNVIYYHGQQLRLCDKQVKQCIKVSTCLRVAFLKQFVKVVEPLEDGHSCCSNCHQQCKCSGEKCGVDFPVFEHSAPKVSVPLKERSIDKEDCSDLSLALHELQERLSRNIKFPVLGNAEMAHGFSDEVIKGIVSDASHIFDASYLIENHNIMSLERARDIIEVFHEIFEDIDILNDKLFDRSLNQYMDVSNAVVNCSHRDGEGEMYCFQNYFDSGSSSEQEEEIPCEDN